MEQKLFESEWKVMELVWEMEPVSAKRISVVAAERIGWNKNTTYTILKKLVDKGVIRREEPGFLCTALLSKKDARRTETADLINRIFQGSKKAFLAEFLSDENLSREELEEIRQLIERE
ncbi:MAG: BlaI/MecI/CopY family transcriptional regulator [Ruminococcaceae bacterium]|nr:BlaI/MecI/CopY family transcriptional regulator [Oscillospiraceae bacterium]